MTTDSKSIHELDPLEGGGTAARKGFVFQDHVAVGFCLEMALSDAFAAVWCETLDDITLIRKLGDTEEIEFVQVKAEELDQLWSLARLCARERKAPKKPDEAKPKTAKRDPKKKSEGKAGTSVLEKSLANDRCLEPCRFRIVTRRPPTAQLKVLQAPLDGGARTSQPQKLKELQAAVLESLPGLESPNGHDAEWWAERTVWDAAHDEDAVRNRNLGLLEKVVEKSGRYLASDQRSQLYDLLLLRVQDASSADKYVDRDAGKITRSKLLEWLDERTRAIEVSGSTAGGKVLQKKLRAAGIASDTAKTATELRRSYLWKRIKPDYLQLGDARTWEDRIRARLNSLRAALDSGEVVESGVDFHARSLKALEQLRQESMPESRPPEEFVQGCMYHITDVCQHRFVRADA